MRIVQVVNSFADDGPNRSALLLGRGLAEQGADCHVVALQRGGAMRDEFCALSNGSGVVLARRSGLCGLAGARRALAAHLSERNPSAALLHLATPTIVGLSLAGSGKAGPVMVPVHHGAHEWDERGPWVGRVVNATMRRLLTRAPLHLAVSPQAAQEVERRIGLKLNFRVIGNSIAAAVGSADVSIPPAGPPWLLGGCGRLVRLKNWITLLEAVAAVRQAETAVDVRLEIVGDGPDREHLVAAIRRLGLEDAVSLVGQDLLWQKRAQRWHGYVQPSLVESFGMAAVEAAGLGLPVVHSNAGGLSWAIDEPGLCYGSATDAKALSRRILQMFSAEGLASWADSAVRSNRRRRIGERFDSRQVAKVVLSALAPHLSPADAADA